LFPGNAGIAASDQHMNAFQLPDKMANWINALAGHKTAFAEISGDVRERDFWPAMTSGLLVIRSEQQQRPVDANMELGIGRWNSENTGSRTHVRMRNEWKR
jgi:hypothetical protein